MSLGPSSLAGGVAVELKNKQFKSSAENLPRKILIIGPFDDTTYSSTIPDTVHTALSANDVAVKCGEGDVMHRMAIQIFKAHGGVPVDFIPHAISGGSQAAGEVDFAGSTGVEAGTLYGYIGGVQVLTTVTASMTPTQLGDALAAAINAETEAPATATAAIGVVTLTAKSDGTWGNDMLIGFNKKVGETTPAGVTMAITQFATGTGVGDVGTSLAVLGSGDGANGDFYTDIVHPYGLNTTVLDDISAYVGAGDQALGLYANTVARPFRSITVGAEGVATGAAAYTALKAITDVRLTDRASGVLAVPGSYTAPYEIAAQAVAHAARIAETRPGESYFNTPLIDILLPISASTGDVWTEDYDQRDLAVKNGISPTKQVGQNVYLQNVITFYRPATVPVASNAYRSYRNIAIIQNIAYNFKSNFEQDRWNGISIVADVVKVTDVTSRVKARDVDAVLDDLVALAKAFESKAWIYSADFTITELAKSGSVSIRSGGTGFDCTFRFLFSGEGGIINNLVEFDTSLAAVLS